MKIVQITPEIHPFTVPDRGNTDHLGYNIAMLSRHLGQRGHEVSVFSPLYSSIKKDEHNILPTDEKVWVTLQNNVYEFDVYKSYSCDVEHIFLCNNILFDRRGIYGYGGMDFNDNDARFGAFCQASMNYIAQHMPNAEVLHSHNWQAALVPIYSKLRHVGAGWKNVFTVHDLSNQGIFNRFSMETLGLPWSMYTMEELEFYDSVNLVKGGVIYSDLVVALSAIQAESMVSSSSGFGLEGVFVANKHKLAAASNGIDYEVWNPEKDDKIFANFSVGNLDNRYLNKSELCKIFNLKPEKPLVSVVGRYVRKPGIDMVLSLLPEFFKHDINLFLFGKSEEPYVEKLIEQQNVYPNLRVVDENEYPIFNLLMASSDFSIAPQLQSFLGANKRIAMRYGAIPIVRGYSAEKHFLTDNIIRLPYYGAEDLSRALSEALELYKDKGEMRAYVAELMKYDNSWELSAEVYENLYKK